MMKSKWKDPIAKTIVAKKNQPQNKKRHFWQILQKHIARISPRALEGVHACKWLYSLSSIASPEIFLALRCGGHVLRDACVPVWTDMNHQGELSYSKLSPSLKTHPEP